MLWLQVKGGNPASDLITGWVLAIGAGVIAFWGVGLVLKKLVQSWSQEVASEAVYKHDDAANAHGNYRRQAEATWRSELAVQMAEHEKDKTAHHGYALEPYVTRFELQNSIDKVDQKLDAFKDAVVWMQTGLKDQLNEHKDALEKIDRKLEDIGRGHKV